MVYQWIEASFLLNFIKKIQKVKFIEYTIVRGEIKAGYGIASGKGEDERYPAGTFKTIIQAFSRTKSWFEQLFYGYDQFRYITFFLRNKAVKILFWKYQLVRLYSSREFLFFLYLSLKPKKTIFKSPIFLNYFFQK